MNRPEPIELENNLGPDAVTGEINRVPWMAYDVDEMDIYIAEKDAAIAELKAENERLKKQSSCTFSDDCLRVRQLKRELAEKDMEIRKLKEMMPKYKQFIEDEDFNKKLVDEYGGYVYVWAGHRYVATPYINVFIKGILRTLYKAIANWAKSERYTEATWHGDEHREELWAKVQDTCLKKAEEYK